MKFFLVLLTFLQGILDRLPSRQESIANQIQELKDELHKMQSKSGVWTARDTATYYSITDKLSKLEKRSNNIR